MSYGNDADFIIVGSGPAGVSAAAPLLDTGRRILMLNGAPADEPRAQSDAAEPAWRRMLGARLEALVSSDDLSPKLQTPVAREIIGRFLDWADLATNNFVPTGALAHGGLSRIWGSLVSEFDDNDLSGWPVSAEEMRPSYAAVVERIGVSGASDDDMAAFYGGSGPVLAGPPIQPGPAAILKRYEQIAPIADFSLGVARNAILTADRPFNDRQACDLSLSCLWGCPRGAIYDARYDLKNLQKSANFRLVDDATVVAIVARDDGWHVHARSGASWRASNVLLAAGALGTMRLVAPLLVEKGISTLRLLNSPVHATPMLVPALLGQPSAVRGHSLAQLGYVLRHPDRPIAYVTGGVYAIAGLPHSSFVARLPLGRRAGTLLFRALASALVVVTTYFPGACSDNSVRLAQDGDRTRIDIRGSLAADAEALVEKSCRRLAYVFRRLGAWALPGGSTARPGTDAHLGGLFPMGLKAAHGTSRYGELNMAPGLFVVDAASHPTVPAKPTTLTVMANADRIGRYLASRAVHS